MKKHLWRKKLFTGIKVSEKLVNLTQFFLSNSLWFSGKVAASGLTGLVWQQIKFLLFTLGLHSGSRHLGASAFGRSLPLFVEPLSERPGG